MKTAEINGLILTNVKINLHKSDQTNPLAYVSIFLNNCFAVHNLKIIKLHNGNTFVSFPSKKRVEGYRDIAHPINQETRALFEDLILTAYAFVRDNLLLEYPIIWLYGQSDVALDIKLLDNISE